MIRLWEDLVCGYGVYKRESSSHLADLGRGFVDGGESYYIIVRKKAVEELPEVLCHELEHYSVAKLVAMLGVKIPSCFERNGARILTGELPPEWAHSDPRCCIFRECLAHGFCQSH